MDMIRTNSTFLLATEATPIYRQCLLVLNVNACWPCAFCSCIPLVGLLPYSGKFSLVQNFAELHVSPSEENFVVLIFAPSPHRDHTHADRLHVWHHTFSPPINFRGSYFRGTQPIREKREILHHAKISLYTVYHIVLVEIVEMFFVTCYTVWLLHCSYPLTEMWSQIRM
jgi:hypothetical protein